MKKHILLIEDNDNIRDNTVEILELANYKVSAAENGKKGVELALKERPDLIICDIMMPVLDGYGVLHLLNKNEATATIPFIFLTAKTERTDLRKGMEMGADDYISKPFTDIELLNAIESRIKKTDLLAAYNAPVNVLNEMINEFEGKDALEKITLHQPQNQYSKKQAVYKEGNHPQKLFYVISGKIKVFIANEEGKSLTIGLYSAGDFLGYTALLEGGVYKESAEALDESVVAEIPLASFENLLHQNPDASKKIIQLLAKNIRQKERQLLDVAYNSLRKRVANALVILMNKYRQPDEEQFSINISREDLANIAGTATESLIRTLSDFKSEKLVSISGSKITVINEQDLKEMVN